MYFVIIAAKGSTFNKIEIKNENNRRDSRNI